MFSSLLEQHKILCSRISLALQKYTYVQLIDSENNSVFVPDYTVKILNYKIVCIAEL